MSKVVANENSQRMEVHQLIVRAEGFRSLWQPHTRQLSGLKTLRLEEDTFLAVIVVVWSYSALWGGFANAEEADTTVDVGWESLRDCCMILTFEELTKSYPLSGQALGYSATFVLEEFVR